MRSRSAAAPRFLNAYYERDGLVLVRRDERGAVCLRRVRSEAVCFIHDKHMTRDLHRILRDSWMTRGMKVDGDWHRVVWVDTRTREKACVSLHKKDVPTCEGAVSPMRRYLADRDILVARPRRVYLDIETDSRVPPAFAAQGKARVLSWALVDEDVNVVGTGLLQEDTDSDERRVLHELWAALDPYDQVISWSGDRFDFPVIKLRSKLLQVRALVECKRWLWLDHLVLFQKMNMAAAASGDEKQSMALQSIAMTVLGEGKDDFDASKTWEVWEQGGSERERLLQYNIKDTTLMPRIEEETGFVELLQTLCDLCGIFPNSGGINSAAQVETMLLRMARKRGYHFPTHYATEQYEKFRGAFVMDPTAEGIVRDVHVADFSTLYPSIILSWNMSPETKAPADAEMRRWEVRPTYLKNQPKPEPTRPDNVAEAPATQQRFFTDTAGVLSAAVQDMMNLRARWKKAMAEATPGTPEALEAERRSSAYKIATNACYGVVGSSLSSLFDRDVAESIATSAAWLIQETIKAAEARGMRVIYGDTDSLFVQGCTADEMREFVSWANVNLYPPLLRERGCKTNHIELDYEKEFERIIFVSAKRYCGRYKHYKGELATAESKPDIVGLEYKRGDSNRLARRLQEEVVNMLVGFKQDAVEDPEQFEPVIERAKSHLLEDELPVSEVGITQRLKKPIKQYNRTKKKDGTWARQQPHIEMARVLEERGHAVGEGVAISFYCVDGGGSPKSFKPAEDYNHDVDRHELWDASCWPPTFRLLSAAFPGYNWDRHNRTRPYKQHAIIEVTNMLGQKVEKKVRKGKKAPEGVLELPWGDIPAIPRVRSPDTTSSGSEPSNTRPEEPAPQEAQDGGRG